GRPRRLLAARRGVGRDRGARVRHRACREGGAAAARRAARRRRRRALRRPRDASQRRPGRRAGGRAPRRPPRSLLPQLPARAAARVAARSGAARRARRLRLRRLAARDPAVGPGRAVSDRLGPLVLGVVAGLALLLTAVVDVPEAADGRFWSDGATYHS